MNFLDLAIEHGTINTSCSKEYLTALHERKLDLSSYLNRFFTLMVFKVDFSYISTKGKSSRNTTSKVFIVSYDHLPSMSGLNTYDRCLQYFTDWATSNSDAYNKFNKVQVLSLVELGDLVVDLNASVNAKSIKDYVLNQNLTHVHYSAMSTIHPKNYILDFNLECYLYEFSYSYETVRGNKKQGTRVIFTNNSFPQEMHSHMLNVSFNSICEKDYRSLSNVQILESTLIGNLSISA